MAAAKEALDEDEEFHNYSNKIKNVIFERNKEIKEIQKKRTKDTFYDLIKIETEFNSKLEPLVNNINDYTSNILEELIIDLEDQYIKEKYPEDKNYKERFLHSHYKRVPNYGSRAPFINLGERYDDHIIALTDKYLTVDDYIKNLGTGNIGIAGVRGFGKTTLMRKLDKEMQKDDSTEYVTVWLSAPTAIDEETFLLSVLAKLATSVGVQLTGNKFWPDEKPEKKRRIEKYKNSFDILVWLSASVTVIFVSLAVILDFYNSVESDEYFQFRLFQPDIENAPFLLNTYSYAVLFLILTILFFIVRNLFISQFISSNSRHAIRSGKVKDAILVKVSIDILEELWYQRKNTETTDKNFSQLGLNLGKTTSSELTRQPFTLPHLVDMWEGYLKLVTDQDSDNPRKVVVFIDEIDKINGTEKIEDFLRILKALYFPTNLFFIVSISEDAYERFGQRGSSSKERDVFDSCFDDMVRIEVMEHDQIKKVINKRIMGRGLPIFITLFIWMLSKGNPRDAIRLTRDICRDRQGKLLSTFIRKLCNEQLKICHDANQEILRKISPGTEERPFRIAKPDSSDGKYNVGEALNQHIRKIIPSNEEEAHAYYLYFAELAYIVTVYEFLSNDSIEESIKQYKKLNQNEEKVEKWLDKFTEVQKHLTKQAAQQALDCLIKFRLCCELNLIQPNKNLTNKSDENLPETTAV